MGALTIVERPRMEAESPRIEVYRRRDRGGGREEQFVPRGLLFGWPIPCHYSLCVLAGVVARSVTACMYICTLLMDFWNWMIATLSWRIWRSSLDWKRQLMTLQGYNVLEILQVTLGETPSLSLSMYDEAMWCMNICIFYRNHLCS